MERCQTCERLREERDAARRVVEQLARRCGQQSELLSDRAMKVQSSEAEARAARWAAQVAALGRDSYRDELNRVRRGVDDYLEAERDAAGKRPLRPAWLLPVLVGTSMLMAFSLWLLCYMLKG